jgi:transcription elongation factor GreA
MAHTYLTEDGLQKLRAELDHLIAIERPAASRAIAEARDKGDLSENAEYDAAKEAQGMLEMKISQLQNMLANAKIIDDSKISTSKIQLLNKVKLKNAATKAVMEYTLVTESEADFKAGKLSIATPIAKALLGKKVGDGVDIKVPAGTMKLEVLSISV